MKTFWTGATGYLFGQLQGTERIFSFRDFLAREELPHEFFTSREPIQLVHAAGVVGAELCDSNKSEAWRVNVEGTRKLLTAIDNSRVRRVIYISTSHVYQPDSNPLRENSVLGPVSHYGETKLAAEKVVLRMAQQMGLEPACIRVFSVLGGTANNSGLAGLLERIVNGSDEKIGFADDVRDFQTPVQYAQRIQAVLRLANLPPVINVGGGVGLPVGKAVENYLKARGRILEDWRLISGVSMNPRMVADINLLSDLTGLGAEQLDLRPAKSFPMTP